MALLYVLVSANYGCTERGGICSNSLDCPMNGGEQEKLEVNCCKGKACCKCTDKCPEGSSCIPSNATCDGGNGKVDPLLCCGDQVCCTPTPCVENNGCTERGGMCSDSSDCPTTGGEQDKLEVNCCQAKACCNCTDKCPEGSSCIPSNATCDGGNGIVDSSLCCDDQVCCTPCVENNRCTERGGMCSDSSDCPTTDGEQEKLEVNCCQEKACCNCTDKCPEGSSCIPSNATCDGGNGIVDSSLCCGDQVCCTPCVFDSFKIDNR
ncbi:keratin-associated protein 5-9-like [Mytilus trossulus]|uniref:keratin-associated protein 5-9-like n=1 Tax=Mytilus trossulus TaxID=6551 RepID=UPI0030048F1D